LNFLSAAPAFKTFNKGSGIFKVSQEFLLKFRRN